MFLDENFDIYDTDHVNFILSETYFGKNPDLLECESCFMEMKQFLLAGKNPNNSTAKSKIESITAKLFGFEKVYLCVLADENNLSGFTPTYFYTSNKDINDDFFTIVRTAGGIRYKNPKDKILYVYTSNFVLRNCTSEMFMGLYLHEIGHNFFLIKEQAHNAKNHLIREYVLYLLNWLRQNNWDTRCFAQTAKFLIELSVYSEDNQLALFKEYKKYLSNKEQDKAIKAFERSQKFKPIKDCLKIIKKIFSDVLLLPFNIMLVILTPLLVASGKSSLKVNGDKTQGYNAEKFSDNFAASYGYAVGVTNIFKDTSNFGVNDKLFSKIPIMNISNYLNRSYQMFAYGYGDVHPDDIGRCKLMLEKLKHELNANKDNLDPKHIKDIEDQIESIEKLLKHRPIYQKVIDGIFSGAFKKRDKIGSNRYSSEDIFDFDEKLFTDIKIEDR